LSDYVDPNDFVITRKRKKYRFAMFANAKNCFEFDDWLKLSAREVDETFLGRPAPVDSDSCDKGDRKDVSPTSSQIVAELGAGTGLFTVALAEKYPEKTFAAIDVKADRLQKGAYTALEKGLTNIVFIRARADQIDQLFDAHSLEQIWLTFPDPFGRPRSARRRMTHPIYLETYAKVLQKNGVCLLKHDNIDFFHWSLEQLVQANWRITQLSFDLHDSELADDYKILTTYEQRWLSEGRTTYFASATPSQNLVQ